MSLIQAEQHLCFFACSNNNIMLTKLFLEFGADVFQTSKSGISPIYYVCSYNQNQMVQLFFGAGFGCQFSNPTYGVVTFGSYLDFVESAQDLSSDSLYHLSSSYTSGGESLLHLAVKNSHLYMVELLLKNGANVNIQDESENTALHYAASNGKKDFVALLIKHGADINLTNVREQKPLDYANQRGFNEISVMILQQNPTNDIFPKQNQLANNPIDLTSNSSISKEDIKSKLKELKELLEDNLISEDEFNERKAELLGRL